MNQVLKIKRRPLISVLDKVNMALPSTKTPLSSITQILMIIEEGNIKFVSTDLRKAITTSLSSDFWSGNVEKKQYLIPGKLILDIIKKVNDEEIILQFSHNQLAIKTEKSSFSFQLMSPEEFPEIPVVESKDIISASPKKIITIFKRGLYAAAKEMEREGLSGALMSFKGNTVRVVTTDGHRLSLAEGELDGEKGTSFSCILHSSDLRIEYFNIFNLDEDINTTWDSHQIDFNQGTTRLTLKTMNIKFPDYEGIIPTSYSTFLYVKTSTLLESLERLTLLSSTEPIRFSLGEKVTLNLSASGVGEGLEELDIEESEGSNLEVHFNSRYLLEALRNSQAEKVFMGFNGSLSPVTISNLKLSTKEKASDGSYYLALIMPLQF